MVEDTRTFKKYQVTGALEIRDGRTEEFVPPGGVVELSSDPHIIEEPGRDGPVRIELAGTDVFSLLKGGLVAEVQDAAPAKTPKA